MDKNLNFRDIGESINDCLQRKELPENRFFRASGFFSGWSCEKVGNPTRIFSLNYNNQDGEEFYCRNQSGVLKGEHFQEVELSDLEFVNTWKSNPKFVLSICHYLDEFLKEPTSSRLLIHCEAGRDRTGAVSAILAAIVWEMQNEKPLSDELIDAIECDYRKSKTLKPEKYGRVAAFLKESRKEFKDIRGFYHHYCKN